MKTKLSETLKENGIDFTFPLKIKNANGKETYYEDAAGFWIKSEYDDRDVTYSQDSDGFWAKHEYDANGNRIYYENSDGCWSKSEYDESGETYYENSGGYKVGTPKSESCDGKIIEIDGARYTLNLILREF